MSARPAPLAERTDALGLYETLAIAGSEFRYIASCVHLSATRNALLPRKHLATARSAAERVLAAITEYEAGR